MIRVRRGAGPLLAILAGAAAVAGCVLPWEDVRVRAGGVTHTQILDGFHGSGLAACVGAALALLMGADRLLRPRPSQIRDAGIAFAGALVAIGAGLFTSTGGFVPVKASLYEVSVQPGLIVAGAGGALLVLSALPVVWRRGGSRSPASSAASAPR